jgi:LPXTG-motif cell wall-anchored protein
MIPSTGSETWDVVLQVGIALALLVSIVLLIKNYRDRGR